MKPKQRYITFAGDADELDEAVDHGVGRILAKIQHLHELLERYERYRQHRALLEALTRIETKLDAYNAREGK